MLLVEFARQRDRRLRIITRVLLWLVPQSPGHRLFDNHVAANVRRQRVVIVDQICWLCVSQEWERLLREGRRPKFYQIVPVRIRRHRSQSPRKVHRDSPRVTIVQIVLSEIRPEFEPHYHVDAGLDVLDVWPKTVIHLHDIVAGGLRRLPRSHRPTPRKLQCKNLRERVYADDRVDGCIEARAELTTDKCLVPSRTVALNCWRIERDCGRAAADRGWADDLALNHESKPSFFRVYTSNDLIYPTGNLGEGVWIPGTNRPLHLPKIHLLDKRKHARIGLYLLGDNNGADWDRTTLRFLGGEGRGNRL